MDLLQSHGIPIINGRAYHPQTQGSVEKANDIFKQRLIACQAEYNTKEWMRFLPEIARVVNTTRPSCLPPRVTPFEVFFGRKPHWLTDPLLNVNNQPIDEEGNVLPPQELTNDSGDYPETDTEDAAHILTELERQIKQSNARTAARMVKKVNKKMKVFTNGSIVSLAIPAKLRLKSEARRLLCRITKVAKNQYTLICAAGPIKGSHNAGQLNEVLSPNESSIPLKFTGWKKAKLSLAMAVAKVNNRGSIAAAQKANRLANKGLLDQATNDLDCGSDDSGDDDELDNELVERQLLEEHSLSGPLISEPVASEPVASEPIASEPVASESIRSTRLRKRTQAAVEVEDEPVIRVSQRNLSGPLISEPVASESIRSTRLRKRTQAAVEVEDELVIRVSQRKRQKRAL
jgi:hypothetical protein